MALQNLVNHIAIVLDASGSMSPWSKEIVQVFDAELENLKQRSVSLDQETRISIYLFSTKVQCLVFDMDVMRMKSLAPYYKVDDMTALVDGCTMALDDLEKTPTHRGDHAFLLYVLTDGYENASSPIKKQNFPARLRALPDNWTVACLVPNAIYVHGAKGLGFAKDQVAVWDVSATGIREVGTAFRSAMDSYMTMRSQGVRGTKSFFTPVDATQITKKQVATKAAFLDRSQYAVLRNMKTDRVHSKDLVVGSGFDYENGKLFYELIKKETIQPQKDLILMDKADGAVFAGPQVRQMLGLAATGDIKVAPGDFGQWRIFVQSTAPNRNMLPGQYALYRPSCLAARR